jgi:hypothetical protein
LFEDSSIIWSLPDFGAKLEITCVEVKRLEIVLELVQSLDFFIGSASDHRKGVFEFY